MSAQSLKYTGIIIIILIIYIKGICHANAPAIEIPGSFNPVGSGARAMGMGGAFMGIADDATASSWNPGALIHLKQPEFSIVFSHDRLTEINSFGKLPDAFDEKSLESQKINYLSAALPLNVFNKNMVIAVSAQRLYELSRNWEFNYHTQDEIESMDAHYTYEQTGDLYAIGLSWCMELIQPKLSFGVTLNRWGDGLFGDDWKRQYHMSANGVYDTPYLENESRTIGYSFEGLNVTMGMVWEVHDQWRLGAVFKSPFNAEIHQTSWSNYFHSDTGHRPVSAKKQSLTLEMPLTYGLGILYRCHDNLYLAADIYETHWQHFVFQTPGGQTCPLSGHPRSEFQLDRTYQMRLGGEYVWTDPIKRRLIPIRMGLFYDPMPSDDHGDDIFGFSLGTGWTLMDQFSIDLAYQFRFGNDVGEHYLSNMDFSQDIRESKIYFSLILY